MLIKKNFTIFEKRPLIFIIKDEINLLNLFINLFLLINLFITRPNIIIEINHPFVLLIIIRNHG